MAAATAGPPDRPPCRGHRARSSRARRAGSLVLALAAGSGCRLEEAPGPASGVLRGASGTAPTGLVDAARGGRVVDLTHPLSTAAPFWPSQPDVTPFRYDTLAANSDGSPSFGRIHVPEHFGTHIDAPSHGGPGLRSVDRLGVGSLILPAVVIDAVSRSAQDPDFTLTDRDILAWEAEHGPVPPGSAVLLATGWSDRWSDPAAYRNLDSERRQHFPAFHPSAARFLVEQRDIVGIGVDAPSVDAGAADGLPVHGIANGSGLYHLENLNGLAGLPPTGITLIVAPMKIEGGSGAPVRVFAVVPP